MSDRPVRVVVVEDDPLLASGLQWMVSSAPGLDLAGVFHAAEPALSAMRNGLVADVVVADLGLPGMSGQELIRTLAVQRPCPAIVVFTIYDDDDNLFEALRAGATGYLLKDAPPDRIVQAILEAHAGGAPMSPGIARRVLEAFRGHGAGLPAVAPPRPPSGLSPRETEVLDLLARGFTYDTVGRGLGITTGTVQAHVKAIYRKLEVASKSEATREAYLRGILR